MRAVLGRTRTDEELVAELADFLQEHVYDQAEASWGQARPSCPGHPHPAIPEVLDGRAWWRCPRTGARVAVIGEHPG